MRGRLIGRLHVAAVTELAEVAEGMRDVPIVFRVDRVFAFHLVTVLARRGLRSALGQTARNLDVALEAKF